MQPPATEWGWSLTVCAVLVALSASTAATSTLAAERDPVLVIGASGLGLHKLHTTDAVRQQFGHADDRISLTEVFVEWYPRPRWGLAYRGLTLGNWGLLDDGQRYSLEAHALGFQYLPVISDDRRTRLGLHAAAGSATYEYGYNVLGAQYSGHTGGPVYLAGVYLDQAIGLVGYRAGWGWLQSALREIEINGTQYAVDVSGMHAYLDVRAAF